MINNKDYFSGFGQVWDLDKNHVLLYRELGYRTIFLRGFDTMEEARNFIHKNKDRYTVIKRFEGGK